MRLACAPPPTCSHTKRPHMRQATRRSDASCPLVGNFDECALANRCHHNIGRGARQAHTDFFARPMPRVACSSVAALQAKAPAGTTIASAVLELDDGHPGTHAATVATQALTRAFYGEGPRHWYFNGCSNGARWRSAAMPLRSGNRAVQVRRRGGLPDEASGRLGSLDLRAYEDARRAHHSWFPRRTRRRAHGPTNPDLTAFKQRRDKLLKCHGWPARRSAPMARPMTTNRSSRRPAASSKPMSSCACFWRPACITSLPRRPGSGRFRQPDGARALGGARRRTETAPPHPLDRRQGGADPSALPGAGGGPLCGHRQHRRRGEFPLRAGLRGLDRTNFAPIFRQPPGTRPTLRHKRVGRRGIRPRRTIAVLPQGPLHGALSHGRRDLHYNPRPPFFAVFEDRW